MPPFRLVSVPALLHKIECLAVDDRGPRILTDDHVRLWPHLKPLVIPLDALTLGIPVPLAFRAPIIDTLAEMGPILNDGM